MASTLPMLRTKRIVWLSNGSNAPVPSSLTQTKAVIARLFSEDALLAGEHGVRIAVLFAHDVFPFGTKPVRFLTPYFYPPFQPRTQLGCVLVLRCGRPFSVFLSRGVSFNNVIALQIDQLHSWSRPLLLPLLHGNLSCCC